MDPLQSFKAEMDGMFEKCFNDLNQKSNLSKTILANLSKAAEEQSQRINYLQTAVGQFQGMQQMKKSEQKPIGALELMQRLQTVEDSINRAQMSLEGTLDQNKQIEKVVDRMLLKTENIKHSTPFAGGREELRLQVQEFDRVLNQAVNRTKQFQERCNSDKPTKILSEPIITLDMRLGIHNENNQNVLKARLRELTEKMGYLDHKIQEAASILHNEANHSGQQQQNAAFKLKQLEADLVKIRSQMTKMESQKKESLQKSAASLDQLVEDMLVESKKLEARVNNLRNSYEHEKNKR